MTNGYNVKSFKIEIAHYHDKVEGYLSDSEIKVLLEVAKKQDTPKRKYLAYNLVLNWVKFSITYSYLI